MVIIFLSQLQHHLPSSLLEVLFVKCLKALADVFVLVFKLVNLSPFCIMVTCGIAVQLAVWIGGIIASCGG
jgi:hypothetical protein